MKKLTGVIVLMTAVTALAIAQTGATTATLTLQGEVPARISIEVVAADVAADLDLTTDQSDLEVATATETSNVRSGYTVTLASANGGRLLGQNINTAGSSNAGAVENVPYTISYSGSVHDLSNGTATLTDVSARNIAGGNVRTVPVLLSYTGDANLGADTYQDTLTFTITAK